MRQIYTFTIVAGDYTCPNRCPFCISKMTPEIPFSFPKNVDWEKFRKAVRIAVKYNANNVLITGKGEATLKPNQITRFLMELKDKSFARIELQTDGFTFLNNSKHNEYLRIWRDLGLDLIAISVNHYRLDKNKEIFKSPHVKDIDTMISVYRTSHRFNIRLSCLLLKGYIDSIEKVKSMVLFAKSRNVMQLTLRKLGKPEFANNQYSKAVDRYSLSKKFYTKLEKWLSENAKLIDILPHGAVVYEYNNQNVCLTDCLTQDFGKEKIRQLIFYPNGWLCTNWEHPFGSRIL